MMCQWTFTHCKKCTTLVCNVDNKRGYAYVGRVEGTREISVPSNFAVNLKLLKKKKKKILKKQQQQKHYPDSQELKKKKLEGR